MQYRYRSTMGEMAATEKGRRVLQKHIRYAEMMQNFGMVFRQTLEETLNPPVFGMTPEKAEAILADLNGPLDQVVPEAASRKSLDEIDRESFHAGRAPFDTEPEWVDLTPGAANDADDAVRISLDGTWEMVSGGETNGRLCGAWDGAIPAAVPGSVHSALVKAGRLPDPTVGKNQILAREESFKVWWMKKEFSCETPMQQARLLFGGICNRCSIWLNGTLLGEHEGMFGGPEYDVTALLKAHNTLIVKLEAIPFRPAPDALMQDTTPNPANNESWKDTVVFNNVYGWHYSNLPSLGIWRSVCLEAVPEVEMPDPFLATVDAGNGEMRLQVSFSAREGAAEGVLEAAIVSDNFDGESYRFTRRIVMDAPEKKAVYAFRIPNPKLWWPNDLGEQNLYRLVLRFTPANGRGDRKEILFGIRTVTMEPLPAGPHEDKYNWTFIINGKPCFIKGTGWCTMDPLMDFSRERYARLIHLAQMQHIQMMRAWGSGMPETDDFYELCSRYGILIIQEWPTAWDSHLQQPYAIMEETIRLNTLRLRNSPALAMWGAGNESPNPFGDEIDMMGRYSIELDGTRPFHRGEGWGGSTHNYQCWWGREALDFNTTLTSDFFGEFGLACVPCYESIARYLPEEELSCPPPHAGEVFTYHTPIFGTADDISRLTQYAGYFLPETYDMRQFIFASQLSQATGIRHTLERARVRWPDCAGALYYKMNDNFPAASWACVDWYGAPKIGHYIFQDAFAPLHACVLPKTLNMRGTPTIFEVFLLDDADALAGSNWEVRIAAFDKTLKSIREASFTGTGSLAAPAAVGELMLKYSETDTCPLLLTTEVWKGGVLADRTFYWFNFENEKGCLFKLPKTTLTISTEGKAVTVRNTGMLPAVGVELSRPGYADQFTVSDNVFWLNAGESKIVSVNCADDITVSAWNAE